MSVPFNANTAPDGLFCKMGNIRIIFVGTGVPDGPSKHKSFLKKEGQKTFNVSAV